LQNHPPLHFEDINSTAGFWNRVNHTVYLLYGFTV